VGPYKGGSAVANGRRHNFGGRWGDVVRSSPSRRLPTVRARRPARVAPGRAGRPVPPFPARERFLEADEYRADREWQRYDGTAQRDLFRVLRERFLARHCPLARRVLDAGSGPGRFTGRIGAGPGVGRVALDISREMLDQLPIHWAESTPAVPLPDLVRGDVVRSPFTTGAFDIVAGLGNILGFAGAEGDLLFESLLRILAPGGTLLLEVAPGPGERSRYLHRLPTSGLVRLLRSPPRLIAARAEREGFTEEPRRRKEPGDFRRVVPQELRDRLLQRGFLVEEILAIAPALGPDPARLEAIERDPKAWTHLLEMEEALGRIPDRWPPAAAVLVAATAPPTA
jgi:SAM-dependent methyltransferase